MKAAEAFLFALQLMHSLAEINFGYNQFNEDENRRYIKQVQGQEEDSSSLSQNSANHFSDTVPGDLQLDYPTYTNIPPTGFSCKGKVNWQYYADIDADCQVFHICESQYSKISFLCPIGSVFNQRHLVCDWWYNVDCIDAEDLYLLRSERNEETLLGQIEDEPDKIGFDLNLASSGGNAAPSALSHADKKRTGTQKKIKRT